MKRKYNSYDRAKLGRALRPPLPREFQHQISTHREARQGQARNPIPLDQLPRHGRYVVRQAGVVQHRGQGLRATTVPLVVADHVHARHQPLLRDSADVL